MASAAFLLNPDPEETSNYGETLIQQSLLFSYSLKDLKILRSQLYSAAEYFERSYTNDDQEQIVEDALKDYAIKAIVNTVGHLGSATCNVNELLRGRMDEVSGTELRVSCIEQRLRTCQQYIDHLGVSQQTLIINSSKYHRRYTWPDEQAVSHQLPPLGSTFLSRPTTPSSSRPTPPNSSVGRRHPSGTPKSVSMHLHADKH